MRIQWTHVRTATARIVLVQSHFCQVRHALAHPESGSYGPPSSTRICKGKHVIAKDTGTRHTLGPIDRACQKWLWLLLCPHSLQLISLTLGHSHSFSHSFMHSHSFLHFFSFFPFVSIHFISFIHSFIVFISFHFIHALFHSLIHSSIP